MTADPNPEPVTVDPVLAERTRAAMRARDVLFGMDPSPSDVIIVADWLLTGRAELALQFDRAVAENYQGSLDEHAADAVRVVEPTPIRGAGWPPYPN